MSLTVVAGRRPGAATTRAVTVDAKQHVNCGRAWGQAAGKGECHDLGGGGAASFKPSPDNPQLARF